MCCGAIHESRCFGVDRKARAHVQAYPRGDTLVALASATDRPPAREKGVAPPVRSVRALLAWCPLRLIAVVRPMCGRGRGLTYVDMEVYARAAGAYRGAGLSRASGIPIAHARLHAKPRRASDRS